MRKREARGEESREPEKKGSEDGDDEWVTVVPFMEAGGSRLQTIDPKDVVEKIVVDELEERKTGRPMEKEKGREKEEKENMKAKDDSEVMDSMEAKEHQRARGRSRTRKKKQETKVPTGPATTGGKKESTRGRSRENVA